MSLDTFQQVFLPYCVRQNADGTFSILNREYENLGTVQRGPIGSNGDHYSMKGLDVESLNKLSHNARTPGPGGERFWFLYDEGCLPDSSKANWNAYAERLWKLCKFELKKL